MTENMKLWLQKLYLEAADEHREAAKNCHIFALGSETQKSAVQFEAFADEHREFASILEDMAKEIDIDCKKQFIIKITDTNVYINDKLCECAMPMDKENHEDDLNKKVLLALADEMGYEATFLFEEMVDRLYEMLDEVDE